MFWEVQYIYSYYLKKMLSQALEYRTSIIKFNIMELKKKVLKETLI